MADETADSPLGALIRRQRELQELSLRQLASLAGISNPYLSQIERGLREPSGKVLEALAENLELSAEALYDQAGRSRRKADRSGDAGGEPAVVAAIKADTSLTGSQRRALLEVYAAFAGRRPPS